MVNQNQEKEDRHHSFEVVAEEREQLEEKNRQRMDSIGLLELVVEAFAEEVKVRNQEDRWKLAEVLVVERWVLQMDLAVGVLVLVVFCLLQHGQRSWNTTSCQRIWLEGTYDACCHQH